MAALDPGLEAVSDDGVGIYLEDCKLKEPAPWARDPVAAEELWRMTEDLVGQTFNHE